MPMKNPYRVKIGAFLAIVAVNVLALGVYVAGLFGLTTGSMRDLWPVIPLLTLAIMTFVAWGGGRDLR